ncbi:hypothetical protein N7582_003828 [Saccharomyces uvarum]|uniref:Structure-specific endonuclease subunit SLX4 n=1 Tax=Saccharomyces uvarum TaxID=230603 RepID=A0AA35J4Z4_SACUV|nr:hypothetical protein N7582_003828 [Saccharomyces uvarum]CAI4046509.1 hypothetical protein SUVC_12G1900 [Saccharomyces uvarum]
MEFQRAQRNLKFLQNEDSMNITTRNELDGGSQRVSSIAIETQIPDVQFSLSSDDDSINTKERKSSVKKSSVANQTSISDTESNTNVDTINTGPSAVSQPDVEDQKPDTVEENMFINTQIQSRLDDAEEETNLKSKLKQFKYALKNNNSCDVLTDANTTAKRRPAIRKTRPKLKSKTKSKRDPNIIKNITEFNINNYERSRTTSLLKQLSGKHKKVLDIIKIQEAGNNSSLSKAKNGKGGNGTFDTYSEQEWKHILKLLLEKFPHSESTDLNEVQKFLYGSEQSSSSLGDPETSHKRLWTASQLPPELSDESAQPEQETQIRNSQSAVNFLSLSQVMDDKSEIMKDEEDEIISGGLSASSPEYGNNIEGQESSAQLAAEDTELKVAAQVNEVVPTDDMARKPILVEVDSSSKDGYDDHDNISIVSDSTDEASTLFPLDPYRYVFIENEDKPGLVTDTMGSTQFFTPNTSPLDGIIDLTQESFKAVRSLISPLKAENNKTAVSQVSNQVQVPATRTPTIIPQKNLTKILRTGGEVSGLERFIRVKLLHDEVSQLDPVMKCDCCEIAVNDSEEEDTDYDDKFCIADIELINFPKSITQAPPPNLTNNDNINNKNFTATTSFADSPEKFHEIITSQSMKELRQSLKTVGLKPMRTKLEIIESLQTASQILSANTIVTPGDSDEQRDWAINFSKLEIFDHLTELIQSFPDFLERIYTFEPIPLNELIEKLFSVEPFISQIDEMTIREWADIQGICLRNDKK